MTNGKRHGNCEAKMPKAFLPVSRFAALSGEANTSAKTTGGMK
jgi:hypothetical protein